MPAIELVAQSPGLLIAGEHLDTLTLAASVEGTPEAADGKFRLAATARDVAAELAAAVELRRPRLRLSDVSLSAPRTRAGGNLSIDLERQLVEGELTGRVEQLRELARCCRCGSRARSSSRRAPPPRTARRRSALGPWPRPRGRFRAARPARAAGRRRRCPACAPRHRRPDPEGFEQGGVALREGSIRAEGTPQALNVRVAATGQAHAPFDLDARAGVTLGERTRVRIEQLDGRLADQPLRLAGPATVTLAGDGVAVSDVNLRLGQARRRRLRSGPQQVAAEATLEQLPLALLGRLGAPELSGQLGGRLSLRGAADNPSGSIRLEATDVAVPAPRSPMCRRRASR